MKRISLIALILLAAPQLRAMKAKPGFVKVELSSARDTAGLIPVAELLARFGGDEVADYGAFRVVYVPKGLLGAFEKNANAAGLRVRAREEIDRIDAPGASFDVRHGILGLAAGNLIRSYPAARRGLYLLQFIGPIKAEWSAALRDLGWTVVGYLPSNAYVLAGRPSLVAATNGLPFVQFLDFYHPFEKAAGFAHDAEAHDLIVEVSPVDDRQQTIDAITKLSLTPVRVQSYPNDVYVHARLSERDATQLLSDPLVIGIGSEPVIRFSDERVAASLTTNVSSDGSHPTAPTDPANPSMPSGQHYKDWLTGHCGLCNPTNMSYSLWLVGIADTGLDAGLSGFTHHPDLIHENWGNDFVSPNVDELCGGCDATSHGTLVAGIIAGDPPTSAPVDTGGYYNGQGVAPFAGIFSTKIASHLIGGTFGDIFHWAADATSHGVTIQNHSHNDYHDLRVTSSTAGLYTMMSREYDQATRDSDNDSSNGLSPILFTVSAGNIHQETATERFPSPNYVIPPATAKNVITMGAAENYREHPNHPCTGAFGDGFRNISSDSRRGTLGGYIKPDLVAPATIVVSTLTTQPNPVPFGPDCYDFFPDPDSPSQYRAITGTSFAAPVAAGAAILLKRFFGTAPADRSPAFVKAALIAGSRSIRGGVDHLPPAQTLGPLPNMQQGFGRLTLERLFSQSTAAFDETVNRHFTTSGQTWRTRLTVSNSAQPVTMALVWSDAAGCAGAINPLVNDLDLSILPVATTCTFMQGNSLDDATNGETSHSYSCAETAPLDIVNNVEYARFYATGFTQFDVIVTARGIGRPADPAFSVNNQDFALVALNAIAMSSDNPVPPRLTARRRAANPYAIDLSWTPALNVLFDRYLINRGSTASNMTPAWYAGATDTSLTDASLPTAINTWVYSVATESTTPQPITITSNIDYATTVQFHDAPVTTSTTIQEQHITELRQAIDSILVAGGHSAATWTDPSVHGAVVKPEHINELRSNLGTALAPFLFTPAPYTYPTIVSHQLIHAADINELRNNVK